MTIVIFSNILKPKTTLEIRREKHPRGAKSASRINILSIFGNFNSQ